MNLTDIFNPHMKSLLTEYQIDNKGLVEEGWRVENNPYVSALKSKIVETNPDAIEDFDIPHDIISIHPADGITYLNETIVISYMADATENVRQKYGIPSDMKLVTKGSGNTLEEEFTIKYDTVTGEAFAKVCDSDFEKYRLPNKIPKEIIWGKNFGVGVHMTRDYRRNYADLYFLHNNREVLQEELQHLYPHFEEDFVPTNRGYCMTVDQITGDIVKVKRYIYWDDKELNHLSLI